MTPLIVLLLIIGAPAALLLVLRVNAAIVFFSLCLGSVLVQFVGKDATSIISGASQQAHVADSTVRLLLLFAPALLTALFMIRTVKNKHQFFNVLPATGVGLLAALLAIPLLPPGLGADIVDLEIWHQIQRSQSAIVAASAGLSLIFLWLQRPKPSPKEHKKLH